MQKLFFSLFFIALFLWSACQREVDIPEIEGITTLECIVHNIHDPSDQHIVRLTDLDGIGIGNPPVVEGSIQLQNKAIYNTCVYILNETKQPPEEFNIEIEDNPLIYQLFYTFSEGLTIDFSYIDHDSNGQPIGLITELNTFDQSSGTIQIQLQYLPDGKQEESNSGETLVAATFPITVF